MIYLGYDHVRLQTVAHYKDQKLILQGTERANEIVNALWHNGEDVPYDSQFSMAIREVPYSEQAWSDLLSVAQ